MCLFPKIIKNPKYKANQKNGGDIPPLSDYRAEYVAIGCGMCMECMKQKKNNWRLRLIEDIKQNKNGKFVTLTFSAQTYAKLANEIKTDIQGYELDNAIAKLAVRRFLENWRKKYKKSVRHWLITEIGGKGMEGIHIHGILFTDDIEEIKKKWSYGYVFIGTFVNERTVNYITKYVTKVDAKHKYYKPIILCTPGIGSAYTKTYNFRKNAFKGKETDETYKTKQGYKIALPTYWRNKAYTEEEREALWIKKLDEGIRYVGGEKVKESDEKEYYKLLKHYRRRNAEQGYGSPDNWEAKKYENERRKLKQIEKINKGRGGDAARTGRKT